MFKPRKKKINVILHDLFRNISIYYIGDDAKEFAIKCMKWFGDGVRDEIGIDAGRVSFFVDPHYDVNEVINYCKNGFEPKRFGRREGRGKPLFTSARKRFAEPVPKKFSIRKHGSGQGFTINCENMDIATTAREISIKYHTSDPFYHDRFMDSGNPLEIKVYLKQVYLDDIDNVIDYINQELSEKA